MKRFKRLVAVILPAVLVTGCGWRGEEKLSRKEKPVTITILAGQSTSDAGVEDMIEEKIAQVLPEVKLEWECMDWGENFDARIRAKFAADDVPDIMIGKAQDVKAYYSTGNLAPLEEALREGIKEEALDPVTVEGKLYGVPYNAWYQGVIYHKDIFEKLHLDVPKTQNELEQTVKTLQENGITPFASHYLESWKVGNTTMQFMINDVFSRDAQWGVRFRQGKTSYGTEESIKGCMEKNQYILEHSWEDALLIDQFICDNRFEQKEAAMYLTGSWSLQFSNQYTGSREYGIFPYPNETGDARLIRETNMTFMKSASTAYPKIVDQILRTILGDKELTKEILDFTQTSTVRKESVGEFHSCLQEDLDAYEESGQVIEAAAGNSQLVWSFQNDLAAQELLWLQGKLSLEEVLEYADVHRSESINGEELVMFQK